jgi:aminobenzoyl-glutamate utilization protein B
LNETILASGQATADNLAAQMAQIMFAARTPDLAMLKNIFTVLDRNAESAALAAHCRWRRHWVSKSRPGLPNHAMAEITYRNFERAGPPRFGAEAIKVGQAMQRELGLEPMARPFIAEIEELIHPEAAERNIRATIPVWQTHYTSDDYTDMTWHAPTVRFYVGRATLKAPPGFAYPDWVMNALGGIPATIDPTVATAARTIAGTVLDLMTDKGMLLRAKAEHAERLAAAGEARPWCDYAPPLDFPWPDYVETPRGREWWIPATTEDRALARDL